MKNLTQVWRCGGGTQSVCIAALIVQGRLKRPDIAGIADTGRETQATWDYYYATLKPALESVGVELHRIKASDWNTKRAVVFHDYVDESRESALLIPAFSTRFSSVGKLSNYCTGRWKIEAMDKWIRANYGLTRSKFCAWIGFSWDEPVRALRMMKGKEYQKGLIRFPLIHEVRLKRQEAIRIVEEMGWPTPPRSACWCCPNHSDFEWKKMKEERPDEFAMACAFEREIQQRDPDAWLHSSCVPLGEVDFSGNDLFATPCDSGVCFV